MMLSYDEERLGELLRLLRPAPVAWVRAAQGLPYARPTFADLESALAREGYEPDRRIVGELRVRLAES